MLRCPTLRAPEKIASLPYSRKRENVIFPLYLAEVFANLADFPLLGRLGHRYLHFKLSHLLLGLIQVSTFGKVETGQTKEEEENNDFLTGAFDFLLFAPLSIFHFR